MTLGAPFRNSLRMGLSLVLAALFASCSSTPKQMRFTPGEDRPAGKSFYLESRTDDLKHPYSCSFVEFDGQGDYLDFQQHRDSWKKVKKLAQADLPLLLVIYCHGWKNNSQSGDVVKFNHFLSKLARTQDLAAKQYRVHGVYISWHGNPVRPFVDTNHAAFRNTEKDFKSAIVDLEKSRRHPLLGFVRENLSYWDRKDAAENYVSGVPIARSIFTYASAAKLKGSDVKVHEENKVIVIGHSFGALMMEKSLAHAAVGSITGQWKWGDKAGDDEDKSEGGRGEHDLPFDLLLLVNSAAPSIHAREMQLFLAADQKATNKTRPVIVSLTSKADRATRKAHRIANTFTRFDSNLQRRYTSGILVPPQGSKAHRPIHQSYFYRYTPGHNKLLINRWLRPADAAAVSEKPENNPDAVFSYNVNKRADAKMFFTSNPGGPGAKAWTIVDSSDGPPPTFKGEQIIDWGSGYWVMQCEKEIIGDHGDIWNDKAMECYAGLYRLSEQLREQDALGAEK